MSGSTAEGSGIASLMRAAFTWQVCRLLQKTNAPYPAVAVSTAKATIALAIGLASSLKGDLSIVRWGTGGSCEDVELSREAV